MKVNKYVIMALVLMIPIGLYIKHKIPCGIYPCNNGFHGYTYYPYGPCNTPNNPYETVVDTIVIKTDIYEVTRKYYWAYANYCNKWFVTSNSASMDFDFDIDSYGLTTAIDTSYCKLGSAFIPQSGEQ